MSILPYSVGYINLLGFAVFVPVTMVMARIGAKVVHKIDKKLLSKNFWDIFNFSINKIVYRVFKYKLKI